MAERDHRLEDALGYVQDFLEPAEKAEFEAHLATCEACKASVAEARDFVPKLNQAMLAAPKRTNEELLAAVLLEHARRTEVERTKPGLGWLRWLVFGVVALGALAAVTMLFRVAPQKQSFIGAPDGTPRDAGVKDESPKHTVKDHATCKLGDEVVQVALVTPEGQLESPDVRVRFKQDTVDEPVLSFVDFPARPFEFVPPGLLNDAAGSVCDRAMAVALPEGRMMVLLRAREKTQLDWLAAAVYDAKTHKVLTWRVLPAVYAEALQITAREGGVSVVAVVFYMGDRPQPGMEPKGMREAWLDVTFDGTNVILLWDHGRGEVKH